MKTIQCISGRLLMASAIFMLLNACSRDEVGIPSTNIAYQSTGDLQQSAPRPSETSNTIIHLSGLVVDAFGNAPSYPQTILYNPYTGVTIGLINGNMITYGDYLMVNGTAEVKCSNNGTQLSLHLDDLFPNRTYSVWIEVFQAPGYEGNFVNRIAMGAFAKSTGNYNNRFKSSANGVGQFSATLPEGILSHFGSVTNCLVSDEFEYHIVGVYGSTYGPGHETEYIEHFRFIFLHQ